MNLLDISRHLDVVVVGMGPELSLSRPSGAAIDSRAVKPGDLFFCLPGEHADGHDFAAQAVEKGAIAVIGSRNPFVRDATPAPVMVVPDPIRALASLAKAQRASARGVVVGVTGTSGKTSVKEALASVLSRSGETAKNPVNLNNQIGLPLSMLNASTDAAYWVMEAGINQPGDMDELGDILRPDVALILNAGAGHTQGLGDRGAAHYKAKLLAHLAPQGCGIVSADYPELVREARAQGKPLTHFSAVDPESPCYAAYLGPEPEGRGRYFLRMDDVEATVVAPFPGAFGAENVAAVGAVAHRLGLTEREIAAGFAGATLPPRRFSVREGGAFLLIDDSYNANPLSMGRMLDAALAMTREREEDLLLVLGEMGELGDESPERHYELGRHAAGLSPKAVFWKGGQGEAVSRGLRDAGYAGAYVPVADAAAFAAAFAADGPDHGVILFKGSRANKLEELVAAFAALTGMNDSGKGGKHDL
ncbi:MAG: UDP-N-acetylmuramoyl-tripeptide--D-alanyl-D-alanine ligase [Deltaproteobacteria bacterium]|jgi:UDP-N-acetylmuramoyl-tripeptide--D-alanyl-D-alanine ligase|nr:UDP-N-acetylmuramoyl-tripeptide--D-alanyl-D-alanine ligase [Deltaproteobacteria bacterium]